MDRPPFPGMDPWLEHPALWPDVHNSLITSIRDALAGQVDPRYFVGVEARTTVLTADEIRRVFRPDVFVSTTETAGPARPAATALAAPPDIELDEVELEFDEEIDEWFLEVRALPSRKVVTVIEVLSPTNKVSEQGRGLYLAKRHEILNSGTSLVEIDLLRGGSPMPHKGPQRPGDYRILISRSTQRPRAQIYRFSCRQPIPTVPIPLLPGDEDAKLELNEVLHQLIDRARYTRQIDYTKPPMPPLPDHDQAWADELLRSARATD